MKHKVIAAFIDSQSGQHMNPGDEVEADEARAGALKKAGVISREIPETVEPPEMDGDSDAEINPDNETNSRANLTQRGKKASSH
ncbi:MAG: hypothetical protein ACYDEJ_03240 [Desulfitobacteriaceae bacterium]